MTNHSRNQPSSAISVTEYVELDRWAEGYARGSFNLLVVVGPAGTGKTRTFKTALAAVPHVWLDTHVTPIWTFIEGYRRHHREHREGSGSVGLWLNATGAKADRVEEILRREGLPVHRGRRPSRRKVSEGA